MNRLLLFVFSLLCHCAHGQAIIWISACSDQTFCLNQNSCDEGDVLLFETAVTSCPTSQNMSYLYRIDLFNNGGLDIQSSADTVTGPFPFGTHKITWRASDNCGNVSQCTYLFTIEDCSPPNMLCISGLSQNLDANCVTAIGAEDFVLNISDNCTPLAELDYGIRLSGDGSGFPAQTAIGFDSCDLGIHEVEVWVKDGDGLINQCNSVITVQNNGAGDCVCGIGADVVLQGCALTPQSAPIDSFTLRADLSAVPVQGMPYTLASDTLVATPCFLDGFQALPPGGDYQIIVRARRNDNPLNGVSTFDLLQTSLHILNVQPFQSAYQWQAADVNRSGSVTTFDIVETRKLILGIYDSFPATPSWRFVCPLVNPADILSAVKDTYRIVLPNLIADTLITGLDFIGIKMGDANLSANFADAADDRHPLTATIADRLLEAGSELSIPVRTDDPAALNGWQMAFRVDPALAEIIAVDGLPEENVHIDGAGLVRALWFDALTGREFAETPLFTLKIRMLRAGRLSEAISLANEALRAEVFDLTGAGAISRRGLALRFGAPCDAAPGFDPPVPNPFAQETVFGLHLPRPGAVLLEVYDLPGRRVYSAGVYGEAGYQTLKLRAEELPGGGVYFYRILAGGEAFTGRLIRE